MGHQSQYPPHKLIIPTLVDTTAIVDRVAGRIEETFGPIDLQTEPIPFTFTDYYRSEMGGELLRLFFTIRDLIDPSELASVKQESNRLEQELSRSDRTRRVNLDPGLLSESRLILATTKDRAQRIPLRDGIYAEITLVFHKGRYEPLPWTYADYASDAYQTVLRSVRTTYRSQLADFMRAK